MHRPKQQWQIDRNIPVSLLAMLGLQLVMLISWASYLEARVTQLEVRMASASRISEQIARLEERVEAVREELRLLRQRK